MPVDSEERSDALRVWDAYWAARSDELRLFLHRFGEIERMGADDVDHEKAHLNAIRKRVRAHRALVEEVGCPAPPWTAVSPNLIWNVQNAPAAQITMLLDVHGAAWAPVGACSTFGVALKCGRDAILRDEAKVAIVGTTDPRPDAALVGAFHSARVMPGIGEVNMPFTSLRGTHVSGGSCVWIIGDADWCEARGLRPVGGYVEAVALSSDAEHIITPSKSGPRRAIARAYEEARIRADDVAVIDLHATGTPGDLNELALIEGFVTDRTLITARKGQLGHGMANSGGLGAHGPRSRTLSSSRAADGHRCCRCASARRSRRRDRDRRGRARERRRGQAHAGHRRPHGLRRPASLVPPTRSPAGLRVPLRGRLRRGGPSFFSSGLRPEPPNPFPRIR